MTTESNPSIFHDEESFQYPQANNSGATTADKNSALLERLVLEMLREQRRTRRNRIIFRFVIVFFVILLMGGMFVIQQGPQRECLTECTALIHLEGEISADSEASAERLITSLRTAWEMPNVRGIILDINSPGGSPVQSGQVYDEIMRLRAKYPKVKVYAVVEDMAASGAYYIASATEKIYVDKASLVGSIGVIMQSFGFTEVMHKLGVEQRTQTAGENKAFLDPFSPERPEHKVHIQMLLDNIHQQFITAVKQGRGERLKDRPELFTGLIWDGEQAIKLGLADDFGSVGSVARDVIKAEKIEDFSYQPSWEERFAQQFGASVGAYFWSKARGQLR